MFFFKERLTGGKASTFSEEQQQVDLLLSRLASSTLTEQKRKSVQELLGQSSGRAQDRGTPVSSQTVRLLATLSSKDVSKRES